MTYTHIGHIRLDGGGLLGDLPQFSRGRNKSCAILTNHTRQRNHWEPLQYLSCHTRIHLEILGTSNSSNHPLSIFWSNNNHRIFTLIFERFATWFSPSFFWCQVCQVSEDQNGCLFAVDFPKRSFFQVPPLLGCFKNSGLFPVVGFWHPAFHGEKTHAQDEQGQSWYGHCPACCEGTGIEAWRGAS